MSRYVSYPLRLPMRLPLALPPLLPPLAGGGFSQLVAGLTFGPSLNANPDFSSWGATPTGWSATQSGGSSIAQVGPDGLAGTGAARMQSPTTAVQPRLEQVLTAQAGNVGMLVEAVLDRSAGATGTIDWYSQVGGAGWQVSTTAVAEWVTADLFAQTPAYLFGITAPLDATINRADLRRITPTVQSIQPNATLTYLFEFASPRRGETVEIRFRQESWTRYHAVRIVRNAAGTGYNANMYRVADGPIAKTTLIAAQALGASVNGLRVVMNGTSLSLWTSADGGSNWTQRGTTQTSTFYQTAETTLCYSSERVTHGSFTGVPL